MVSKTRVSAYLYKGYATSAIDLEFADDTTLYVSADARNLLNLQKVLSDICDASGFLSSMGFWVVSSSPPQDVPSLGFIRVPRGTTIRYLGCQVGIDLLVEEIVTPLLIWVRNKLLYWDNTNLSLPGRVLLANYILCASMWYVASTWLFSQSIIRNLGCPFGIKCCCKCCVVDFNLTIT